MVEGRLKRAVFEALRLSGVLRFAAALVQGVPILVWHGVTERSGPLPHNHRRLLVPADLFEQQLRLLRDSFQPISLAELLAYRAARRAPPPRSVVLTFDDGYRNVLTSALPLLQRYGMPASLFVVTGRVGSRFALDALEPLLLDTPQRALDWRGAHYPLGSLPARLRAAQALAVRLETLGDGLDDELRGLRAALAAAPPEPDDDRDLLTWDEVRALANAGVDVGSHGQWHVSLSDLDGLALASNLDQSLAALRTQLGLTKVALAYPYGAWNGRVAGAARLAGYACALTTDPGLNQAKRDPFSLRRMLVGADDVLVRLRASLVGLRMIGARPRTDRA